VETSSLVVGDIVFVDRVLLLIARGGVIWGRSVHAAEMLGEEVFSVEVVVVDGVLIVRVDGGDTEVATPKAELDVLGADMSLPFIL
jgi:hypothetical protein